ncbi:MAG: TolC family protein [Candidatus Eisenbacteria bacterium]|uniref:TolC family protein n=1 Tax=Eiseniibacteriota bacterium TaxID=2212470 RepID=A0A538TRP5_UNCEI|nr:MAG: TolC family protein [Candidatus Eisenbacteria bacterium]
MKPHGLFLALSIALATPSSAQTLDECVALARRHAPAIRVANADVSRAEHGIREARAALAPTLRLGASYVRNNEAPKTVFPNPVTGSTTVVRVGSAGALDVRTDAQLTLYSGGRNGALVSAAEASRSGELHGRQQADADLVLRVSQAFYRVIAAGRLEDAADDALASAEAHRRTSAARVRAGAAPRLDSLQAHVDLAARTTAKVKASEAVHLARVDLETAIGVPLDPAERLVEPGTPALDTPADSATAEQALRARPELAAYDEAIRENAHRARAARAARSPLVNLNAAAEYLGPNRDDSYWELDEPGLKTYKLYAGIGVSMPILDGGLTSARAGALEATGQGLLAHRQEAELEIRREVSRALSDLRVALTVWQSDSSRVAAAREALRTAEAGYKGGSSTATDVRDAESALADARAEEALSLMDCWIARASLDHATGATVKKGN